MAEATSTKLPPGYVQGTNGAVWVGNGYPPPVRRQWYSAKTTGDKLDLVFQNIADEQGDVESVIHLGARDFVVLWSKQVQS